MTFFSLPPRLLGWSAFAGFASLLLALPASQYLTSIVMRLTKGTLAAKDARMKLVNEMFGSVSRLRSSTVGSCADPGRSNSLSFLHGKTGGSRRSWMRGWSKSSGSRKVSYTVCGVVVIVHPLHSTDRNVNVIYGFVWQLVPTLVSVASFLAFVLTGHELPVSVAFTVRYFVSLSEDC